MKLINVIIKRKGKRNIKQIATQCEKHLSVSNTAFVRPNVRRKIRCISLDTDAVLSI